MNGEGGVDSMEMEFYRGKRVLVTGHTGFKGTWLTQMLLNMGAIVTGYALAPSTKTSLFSFSSVLGNPNFSHVIGDIRDLDKLKKTFMETQPEIVLHLAAQPIVRESYKNPVYTYSTNVMGTVNVLECIRTTLCGGHPIVRSFLNVTTDKVYMNKEWCWGYREDEALDGYDPYSNSKSCSELVTHSYKSSFFSSSKKEEQKNGKPLVAISTARAGNVIGGGDFAANRIIPDSVRTMQDAYAKKNTEGIILVRNPHSIRPYQHVLEPLALYLLIAAKQYEDPTYAGYYNIGPDDCDCVSTGKLVDLFCKEWNKEENLGVTASWKQQSEENAPHEASYLKLDCSKVKQVFGWKTTWNINKCVEETVKFVKVLISGGDIADEMRREIECFYLMYGDNLT